MLRADARCRPWLFVGPRVTIAVPMGSRNRAAPSASGQDLGCGRSCTSNGPGRRAAVPIDDVRVHGRRRGHRHHHGQRPVPRGRGLQPHPRGGWRRHGPGHRAPRPGALRPADPAERGRGGSQVPGLGHARDARGDPPRPRSPSGQRLPAAGRAGQRRGPDRAAAAGRAHRRGGPRDPRADAARPRRGHRGNRGCRRRSAPAGTRPRRRRWRYRPRWSGSCCAWCGAPQS